MNLHDWAIQWGVPLAAVRDLQHRLAADDVTPPADPGRSEASVQAELRVNASRAGWRLWRNNVGAFHDNERGIHMRFGLANDSPQVNAVLKSADLIGIRPRIIQPHEVGMLIGQFVSRECKHAGWKFSPNDEHERAQMAWAQLVASLGGDAGFASTPTAL
jgi:hypothetical protein